MPGDILYFLFIGSRGATQSSTCYLNDPDDDQNCQLSRRYLVIPNLFGWYVKTRNREFKSGYDAEMTPYDCLMTPGDKSQVRSLDLEGARSR